MRKLIVYLDVDGVLNHSGSSGWNHTSLVIDEGCLNRYFFLLAYAQSHFDVEVRLCSTWQHYPKARKALNEAGVEWDSICFDGTNRTKDILDNYSLSSKEVLHLVLDDSFYGEGRDNLFIIKPYFNKGGFTEELLFSALRKLEEEYEN